MDDYELILQEIRDKANRIREEEKALNSLHEIVSRRKRKITIATLVLTVLLSAFVSLNEKYVTFEPERVSCYITETGECYHSRKCINLINKHRIETTLKYALNHGYRACENCSVSNGYFAHNWLWPFLAAIPIAILLRKVLCSVLAFAIKRKISNAELVLRQTKDKARLFLKTLSHDRICLCCDLPSHISIQDDWSIRSDDASVVCYTSYSGSVLHMRYGCSSAYFKRRIYDSGIQRLRPCRICAGDYALPEWINKYRILQANILTLSGMIQG